MKRLNALRPTTKPSQPKSKPSQPRRKPISTVTTPSAISIPNVLPAIRTPELRVLLIGNNYCGTPNELRGCYNDIIAVRDFVLSFADKRFGTPKFFILGDDRLHEAPNGRGTGENILRGISWLVADALTGDSLIVHYSGHGVALHASLDRHEMFGVDSAWLPFDYLSFRGGGRNGMIVDNELRQCLVNMIPLGVRLWLTSDSCHSGSVLDLRYNYTDASFLERSFSAQDDSESKTHDDADTIALPTDEDTLIQFDSKSLRTVTNIAEIKGYAKTTGNVVMLSGCTDLQTAADGSAMGTTKAPMGALTWAFLTVLRKNPATPLKYLLKDIRALLQLSKFTQAPQLSSGQYLDIASTNFQTSALVLQA